MIQSNLSTYYYIEEGDQHPFSGRQLLYSPARRSLNLKRGESPDTPPVPPLMMRPRARRRIIGNQILVQPSSCLLQEIRAFGCLFLHQLIMLWLPTARSSLNHVGDPFGSHRTIKGRERRAHRLGKPGKHFFQLAVCRFHMKPAPRKPFGQCLPPRQFG